MKMVPLGDILQEYKLNPLQNEDLPVLTLTEKNGFVYQKDRFNKRLATEDTSTYKVVRPMSLAFNPYLLWAGALAQNTGDESGIISPLYPTFNVKNTYDPAYIYRLLLTPEMIQRYDSIAYGSVPRRRRSSVKDFLSLQIPTPPPLDEQRRIAAILDKADAIRQKRRQAITNLESLSNSMLENQFLGDSRSTTSYALGDLLRSITTGNSPKCRDRPAGTDEWGVLKLSAITSGKFEPTENKSFPGAISEIAKYEVRPGDLLFTRKNTPELVGTATIATSPPPRLAFPDLVFRLEVFEDLVSSIFLQALLMSSTMRNRVRALAVGTSKSMSNISGGRLRGLTIALPSLQRQLQFEQFQRKVLSATHRYSKLLDRDNELFRSLQSRAFRGEL